MSTYAPHSSPQAYRTSAVLTASSGQLVVMLYDGARRYLRQASVAMSERQIELGHIKLTRAEEIIRHLRNTLDHDQGEIADRLHAIYAYALRRLREARFQQDPGIVAEVDGLLGPLRDSWAAIASQ